MSDVIYNISSGFYDSVNGDRLYSAADMNKPYKRVIADGIFPTPQGTPSTDFQVVAVSGMSVAVLAGNAMIGSRWAENTDDVGITIAGNSSSSPRIDSIFLHIDTGMDTRAAGVVYRQGTAAGTPTAPAMVQTDNITELRLADILVAPSAAIITQANITDQRGGSDCPWVAGLIQQVDTSALFDQYRAAYAEQQQDQANEWNTFMDHLARDYDISMSLRKHESTYTSTAAASLIPINIDGYDTTKDLLQVYINGIFAVEGTHYIVKSAAQIQLTNAISAGQKVHFVIYKAVMGGAQPIIPTDEQVQDAVDAYMDAHPGALVVDPELSDTSTHAIQNKAVTEAIENVNCRLNDLKSTFSNVWNAVKDGKCDNTGKTDCTSIVQSAINNANDGTMLFFPKGTYLFNGGITITGKKGITIKGEGTGYYRTMFEVTYAYSFIIFYGGERITVCDLSIKGPSTQNSRCFYIYDNTPSTLDCRFTNSRFYNLGISRFCTGASIDAPCGYNFFNNIRVHTMANYPQSCGFAIGLQYKNTVADHAVIRPNYIYLTECQVEGLSHDTACHGVRIATCQYVWIDKCDFCNLNGNGVYIQNSNAVSPVCEDIYITNTSLYNNNVGVYIRQSANSIQRVSLTGSTIVTALGQYHYVLQTIKDDDSLEAIKNVTVCANMFRDYGSTQRNFFADSKIDSATYYKVGVGI